MHFEQDTRDREPVSFGAILGGVVIIATVFGALFVLVAIMVTSAEASPRRLAYIERVQGLHEVKNRKTIQAMVGVRPDRIPWCGYMVAAVVKKTGGKPPSGYPRALAWKSFGRAVHLSNARKGDIVVFRTKRGYHVSIYSHRSNGRVCAVGGNQSNRIKLTCYRSSTVKWVRR